MKILLITSFLPYPPLGGGKIRQFNLIKELSDKYQLTLISLLYRESEWQHIERMKTYCPEVKGMLVHRGPLRGWGRLFSTVPELFLAYRSERMRQLVSETLRQEHFDIIQVEFLFTAMNLPRVNGGLKCVTVHEPQSLICYRKFKTVKSVLRKVHFFLQFLKARRFEKRTIRRFDLCFTCSQNDRTWIESVVPDVEIVVVPNGVDVEHYRFNTKNYDEKTLVFTGAMDTYANEDAMMYFCRDIFPLIKREVPGVKLYIVGNNPSKKVYRLRNDPAVVVTGLVRDIRSFFGKAEMMVVPIRVGGGTRLKILEAMALGRPVVSTSVGCEGLEVTEGENISIADSPREFAEAVIRMMNDKNLREGLAVKARRLVEEKYDWKIIAKRLDAIYEERLAASKNRQRC